MDDHDCSKCRFNSFDMDGRYCSHDASFALSWAGTNFSYMRSDAGPCKPDGLLFEHQDELPFE